jgi:hypothetical protein
VKRPTSSYIIALVSLLLAGLGIIQSLFYSSSSAGLQGVAIILFLLGVVFCYYVIPQVELREDELVILNPLTRHQIGLGAIESVDTRFSLRVGGEFGSVAAWAAPAPSRLRHRSHSKEDFRTLGLKEGQEVRPSDLPSTISGSYALQIRRAISEPQSNRQYLRSPNWLGIAALVVPAGLVLVSQL